LKKADFKALFPLPANQTARISVQREFLGCDLPALEVLGLGFFGVPLLLLLGTKEADHPLTNHVVGFRTTLGSLAKSEFLLEGGNLTLGLQQGS
jgi:hypothetical protein